jgi:hypothetical protein
MPTLYKVDVRATWWLSSIVELVAVEFEVYSLSSRQNIGTSGVAAFLDQSLTTSQPDT